MNTNTTKSQSCQSDSQLARLFITKLALFGLFVSLLLIFAMPVMADKDDDDDDDDDLPSGRPFQELQHQIDELRSELRDIEDHLDYEREPLRDKVGFKLRATDRFYALDLPKNTHRAIRIEVTLRFKDDGAIFFPNDEDTKRASSNIMYAVVYRNPRPSNSNIELSWIGTNSNGKTNVGSFPRVDNDRPIAEIYENENDDFWLARLVAGEDRQILVEHNPSLEEEGRYVVTVW